MKDKNKIIRVYSGTELAVNLLKDELAQIGISGLIQNEINSGIVAGFSGGSPSSVDLFIQEFDLKEAEPIINDFILHDKG